VCAFRYDNWTCKSVSITVCPAHQLYPLSISVSLLFPRPAFYLYAALKIFSGLLILTMNLEFKAPATNIVSDVMTMMRSVEIVALFIIVFLLG